MPKTLPPCTIRLQSKPLHGFILTYAECQELDLRGASWGIGDTNAESEEDARNTLRPYAQEHGYEAVFESNNER